MNRRRVRVLCPEPEQFAAATMSRLTALTDLDATPMSQEAFAEALPAYDAVFVRLSSRVTSEMISSASQLRVIATPTTGLDHIDLEAARAAGVVVLHLRDRPEVLEQISSTAEHAFALILALARRLPAANAAVQAGEWAPQRHRGVELRGKRLCLVGCGRLGRMVAGYGLAFGMDVRAYDPLAAALPAGVQRSHSLDELVRQADVLSLHAHLTDETRGMIGEREIRLLPAGALVVNTARGELWDEVALAASIEAGRLGGVAADVLADERTVTLEEQPLVRLARVRRDVIVTPHIGGATEEAVATADRHILLAFEELLDRWPEEATP